ncbi:S41 family peptidase [Spirosoma aerophilum]
MSRFVITLLFVLSFWQEASGQARLTPEQLRADIERLRTLLETWHPGYAQYQSPDALRKQFDEIGQRIAQPMTARQFMRVARVASAQIQCLHTTVSLPVAKGQATTKPGNRFLSNLYLTADNQLLNRATGDTIRQINGRSAPLIADSLLQFFASDGPNPSLKHWAVNRQFATVYAARFGLVDTLNLLVASSTGMIRQQIIADKAKPDTMAAYLANQPYQIWHASPDITLYSLNKQPDVAVLQLRSVGGILNQFRVKRIMRLLQKQSVRQLVLDLRNNTGGRVWTATTLLKHLLHQPTTLSFERYQKAQGASPLGVVNQLFRFLYSARLSLRTSVNRAAGRVRHTYTIRPVRQLFAGQLTVLINGGTASAASLMAAYLHEQNRATFVGSESGGSRFVSAGMQVPTRPLHHSGLRVRVPLYQVIHATQAPNDGHGVLPDVFVDEWQSTQDVVMQKALERTAPAKTLVIERP